MLSVYVCDDEPEILGFIKKEIENQILIQEYDMKIALADTKPENLIQEVKHSQAKRNLYFFDVDFKEEKYDGFILGKAIRELDPHGTIIYITSYKELAYKTFQYHLEAFDYIVKDTPEKLRQSVCQCLQSVVEQISKENTDPVEYYTFKNGERLCHIPLKEIEYFETSARSHFVIVHALYERIEFMGNLSDIERQLAPGFLKIHRSYLVALDKIDRLDLKNNRIWIHGKECPVSRKMKSKLLEALNRIP